MEYLSKLNEKQLEAVQATEGYLRVIAGAGSGKTKLLVSRYAYLVKEYGIDSANILCVTFTNKAAGEMKRRIRALIGQEYDTSLICTYHGFCVRVLREDVEKIFYPKEFQIIDQTQQKAVLSEIYQKFELKLDHGSFEKIVKYIAKKKSMNRSYVAKMCSTDKCQILDGIATLDDKIAEEYMQYQKQVYAMDFNDLMFFTLDVFKRCPDVLAKWQDRLNYIQVDEFQDSSGTEMELIDLISAGHKNLMIVGDPDQNIYEWRGSDVKLLVDFDKTHIPTRTVFLKQNYRSSPQILRCANTLIEKNIFRLKKDLFTKSAPGADVYHFHTKNEFAEAEKVVQTVLDIRKHTGCKFAEFAVLYRSGFLSRIIEKKFTEAGVPYEILGGVKFYLRMEIQDIMAYLRLVAFDDDTAFKRIVNKPRRRFGRMKLQRLQLLQGDAPLYVTLKENIDDPTFKNSGAADFVAAIENIRAAVQSASVSELVERVCADSGYEKYIRELGDMERFENLSEFKRIAAEYEKNLGESITLKEFINHISLQSEEDDGKNSDNVKLMTIHAAKGLEFPNVFVIGLSEGIFPSSKTIEERKKLGLEEERRLCYVAITRAEKRLFLLDSEGYAQNGSQKLPSRFLKEIGEGNYIREGAISKELRESADRYIKEHLGEPAEDDTRKQIGDTVEHPAFGHGEIVGYGKNRNSYRIKFDKLESERVLSADYFNREHTLPVIPASEQSENADSYEMVDAITLTEEIPPAPPELPMPSISPELVEEDMHRDDTGVYEKVDKMTASEEEAPSGVQPEFSMPPLPPVPPTPSVPPAPSVPPVPPTPPVLPMPPVPSIPPEFRKSEDTEGYEKVDEMAVTEEEEPMSQPPECTQETGGETQSASHRPKLDDYENLWARDDVPKSGWKCVGVSDLGAPVGVCEMCGHQIIRYVHHMVHPNYRSLGVGCICAGKMEGDVEGARKRENDYKNRQKRLDNFKERKWKKSRNNNDYLKIKNHLLVLYYNSAYGKWKYSLDSEFSKSSFGTREETLAAAFEALEMALGKSKM